ncbi:hypothetical protein R3P38DRAFT_2517986, partial [Favolaschia claudopus]
RAISLCDINLQREVYLDNPRLCYWPRRGNAVRRYYTAELKDRKEMTVVIYEGQNAEEESKEDVAKYMKFRHPSFLQLYGTVHSGNIHGSISYDALIPWSDIMNIYPQCPMLICYTYVSIQVASDSFQGCFGSHLYHNDYTFFLRPSTGRLCIVLEGLGPLIFCVPGTENISPECLLLTIDTQLIIDALTVEQYHEICMTAFPLHITIDLPLTATVRLGAAYRIAEHHKLGSPLAIPPAPDTALSPAWHLFVYRDCVDTPIRVMESGWNRVLVSELVGPEEKDIYLYVESGYMHTGWLSQANHILNRLGISSNTDSHAVLTWIRFTVELDSQSTRPTDWHSLQGFLFLCPPQSFEVGPVSFKCPQDVAYWSFDPLGLDRLCAEQAADLGFPTIRISILVSGQSWNDFIYAGLRQFHQGKGFDPDSQDLARYLGYPLYELYSDCENFLNVDGELI